MTLQLKFLTQNQEDTVNYIIERVRRQMQDGQHSASQDDAIQRAPTSYLCKFPDDQTSIPARVGTTLGSLDECITQKLTTAGVMSDGPKIKVWNPYLCKMYKAAHPYFEAHQNKWGLWTCEKPRMYHKAVVSGADIEINNSGTVALSFNGSTTALTETAHLNWMHGDQKVSDGIQVEIHFYEDENKWIIMNAGCEVAP
jgi:hypothetical protein